MKCFCKIIEQRADLVVLECDCEGVKNRKKRQPSEYQKFLANCLKGTPKDRIRERFKECVLEWKKRKAS